MTLEPGVGRRLQRWQHRELRWPLRSDESPAPFTTRYEDEINKRTTAENEFVMLKKVGVSTRTEPAALGHVLPGVEPLKASEC